MSALFIILVRLTMTLFSEKVLISSRWTKNLGRTLMFMCRRGGTIDACRRTVVTWRFGSWSITFSFTPQRNVAMTQTVASAVQYGLFKHCQWPRRSSKVQKICTYCDLYLIAFSCNFCTNFHFLRMPWPDLALTFGDIMAASENILQGEDNLKTQKLE